jgi:hypothetical protein
VIHAYYALFLECRDALARWGRSSPRESHRQVRLTFQYAADQDLKWIADALEVLSKHRTYASYDMVPRTVFLSDADTSSLLRQAADALVLLDAIDADPARRAAAIASLPPPPP